MNSLEVPPNFKRFLCALISACALSTLFISLSGCVVRSKPMLHPITGEQVTCAEKGFGLVSSSLAYARSIACQEEYEQKGFMATDEYEKIRSPFLDVREPTEPAPFPGPLIGYSWSYLFRDGESIVTETVKEAGEDILISADNGGRVLRDSAWRIKYITDRNGNQAFYHPPLLTHRWPLTSGDTWESTSEILRPTGTTTETIEYSVSGYGTVRVPAGEFEAYHIVGNTSEGRKESEEWYAPSIRGVVKKILYLESGIDRYELRSFSTN